MLTATLGSLSWKIPLILWKIPWNLWSSGWESPDPQRPLKSKQSVICDFAGNFLHRKWVKKCLQKLLRGFHICIIKYILGKFFLLCWPLFSLVSFLSYSLFFVPHISAHSLLVSSHQCSNLLTTLDFSEFHEHHSVPSVENSQQIPCPLKLKYTEPRQICWQEHWAQESHSENKNSYL